MGGRAGVQKGPYDYPVIGNWNAHCDQCGTKYKASDLMLQWDDLRTCRKCWDPRHPQELLRPLGDPVPPLWTRPSRAIFTSPNQPWKYCRQIDAYVLNGLSLG